MFFAWFVASHGGLAPSCECVAQRMAFGGCMTSILSMEYILRIDRQAGNLVTFSEFIFVFLQMTPYSE